MFEVNIEVAIFCTVFITLGEVTLNEDIALLFNIRNALVIIVQVNFVTSLAMIIAIVISLTELLLMIYTIGNIPISDICIYILGVFKSCVGTSFAALSASVSTFSAASCVDLVLSTSLEFSLFSFCTTVFAD